MHTQSLNGFVEQSFRIASRVLECMEHPFNPLSHSRDETVERRRMLLFLVLARHRPNPIARALLPLQLPVGINEALVAINGTRVMLISGVWREKKEGRILLDKTR
jgi:hypothetical protein